MKKKTLDKFIYDFTHLRRDYKKGGAPHKPILLLSVISQFYNDNIKENKVFITPELVGEFKRIWSDLVETDHHCIFALPFYHLRSSSFWYLKPKYGFEGIVNSKIAMKSFSNLNDAVEYVYLDEDLYDFMQNKIDRNKLLNAILDKYFPSTKHHFNFKNSDLYYKSAEEKILFDSPDEYSITLKELQKNLKEEEYFEETFIRSTIFKRKVPIIYKNRCAVTGLQINATFNISMVDACHIKPFSVSYDDTITNGISLSPNIHRAFDRGMLTIDKDYKVVVSNKFNENFVSDKSYSIKQFHGKRIILPKDKRFLPNLENLEWHRQNIFK